MDNEEGYPEGSRMPLRDLHMVVREFDCRQAQYTDRSGRT